MRVVSSARAMQRQTHLWKQEGTPIGFVPTMGYLHEGHESLIRRARKEVGPTGHVVVSIYVNPTQFGPREDFQSYPRDFKHDKRICRDNGVDLIFAPPDREMYPGRSDGSFSTYVDETRLSQGLEGASRPTHFCGVTTVVAKLFHLTDPDVVIFGAKDFQQARIIERMIRDLNFRVRMVTAPIHRQHDGLATSSRNSYLTPEERAQAVVLWKMLRHGKRLLRESGGSLTAACFKEQLTQLLEAYPLARLDYLEVVDPTTLAPVDPVKKGHRLTLAVYVGKTRLIDNTAL